MIKYTVGFWFYDDLRAEAEVKAYTFEQALTLALLDTQGVTIAGDWPHAPGFRITIGVTE